MSEFLGSDSVWKKLDELSRTSRRKRAAVSYVSSDAIIKFTAGDLLVVDASDIAIQNGLTSASVLKRALARGAQVATVPNLHAKVMVFDGTLVVGSANFSINSFRRLIEALLVSGERRAVRDASTWIDDLARKGRMIDNAFLQYLLSIEVTRPPIRTAFESVSNSHLLFFKEVKAGDIEKYRTRSSVAGTGGGARDLRISPASVFKPLLSGILSEPSATTGVSHGPVLSRTASGTHETDVELWRPTRSRPNELRISRFYDVPGWEITQGQFDSASRSGRPLLYVLDLDVHGTITAKTMTYDALAGTNDLLGAFLKKLAADAGYERRSIIGAVDLIKGTVLSGVEDDSK